MGEDTGKNSALKPYLTKTGAFALAVGTSIGWGCLVVSNYEYLAQAGPAGSCIGMALGALVMLIVAANFVYMAGSCRDSGGVYTYVKTAFGYDRAFLVSWFLSITYIAMLWANATSLPLFSRYFFGDIFCFGKLYTLFGYHVYLGEILLTLTAIVLFGVICMRSARLAQTVIIVSASVFMLGIVLCFTATLLGHKSGTSGFAPVFLEDTGAVRQVLKITFITPWAFIGYESITHSSEEFCFVHKHLKGILRAAVIATALLYIMVFLLSVSAYPERYHSWLEYLSDLDHLSGIEALPAFYVAYSRLGDVGVVLLMAALLGLVFSSLIGNMISLSRLFYALSRDRVLPERYGTLNRQGIPEKAVMLVMLLSLPIMFAGRTAVSWIVDITTIGATLLYGFVSAAALRLARKAQDRKHIATGAAGFGLMIVFGIYIICGSILDAGGMSRESQLILIVWSVLGLLYFRSVMIRDHGKRFGKNLTVWAVMVFFIFGMAMLWICEEGMRLMEDNLLEVRNHYAADTVITSIAEDAYMLQYRMEIRTLLIVVAVCMIAVFAVAFGTMFSNWSYVRKCEEETRKELGAVKTMAYRDPLTGVKSKHAFVEKEEELDAAIDQRSIEYFAVIVFDVNGLKHVNDTLGHKAGDAYIKEASALICNTFDHSPVFRTGGDEFVALLNGRDYPNRTELLEGFDRQVEENIKEGKVVVSAGMSEFDPQTDNCFHTVFERADQLMYERKSRLKEMGAKSRT